MVTRIVLYRISSYGWDLRKTQGKGPDRNVGRGDLCREVLVKHGELSKSLGVTRNIVSTWRIPVGMRGGERHSGVSTICEMDVQAVFI